jgi:hypothetical protein
MYSRSELAAIFFAIFHAVLAASSSNSFCLLVEAKDFHFKIPIADKILCMQVSDLFDLHNITRLPGLIEERLQRTI